MVPIALKEILIPLNGRNNMVVILIGSSGNRFVVEEVVSYRLASPFSVIVVVPVRAWFAMHVPATVDYTIIKTNNSYRHIEFHNIEEYDVLYTQEERDRYAEMLQAQHETNHDV